MSWVDYLPSTIFLAVFIIIAIKVYQIRFFNLIDEMIEKEQYEMVLNEINKKLKSKRLSKKKKSIFTIWKVKTLYCMKRYNEALDLIDSIEKKYHNERYLYLKLICEVKLDNTDEAKRLYEKIICLPPNKLRVFKNNLEIVKRRLYPDEVDSIKQ